MPEGTVTVWLTEPAEGWRDLLDGLGPDERSRAGEFHRPLDAARFVTGATMVRQLAGDHLGIAPDQVQVDRSCPTCPRPHGRVLLPDAELFVSVSHSGRVVGVAAFREAEVGLDVEEVGTADLSVRHVLTPLEQDQLAQVPPTERAAAFLHCWTRKESLLKLTGDGLRLPMTDIEVSSPSEPARLVSWSGREWLVDEVRMYDVPVGVGYVASLAVGCRQPLQVRTRQDLGREPSAPAQAHPRGASARAATTEQ